jgi:Asp/Glu/hydantoin racemase
MLYKAKKGRASYGEAIGILLLDTSFAPYIPGDVANATTYSFPVRFKKVSGLTVEKMFNKDIRFLNRVIEAGRELVEEGVKAITGDCGFMALFQREVAKQLEIPVFLSSLLQLPFLMRIVGEGWKVGIITANSRILDNALLKEVGIENMNFLYIKGMEDKENFKKTIIDEVGWLDSKKIENEVVSVAKEMVKEDPRIKVILLECSCLPPYGAAVQEVVNLPVFDYITMINYVYSAVVKKKYEGFM